MYSCGWVDESRIVFKWQFKWSGEIESKIYQKEKLNTKKEEQKYQWKSANQPNLNSQGYFFK